jgi:histidyl-tRNA synthetase
MHNLPQPVRLYYLGPLFRYERPQAGRFRQHHQFGIEALGDGDPAIDAEIIELAWTFLGSLGLRELAILINSTGDPDCRPAYIRELQGYYRPHVQRLCHNCRRRLEENPLRLLDCKENTCQPVIAGAPGGVDHLCAQCAGHWRVLLDHLGNMGLPYRVDKRLGRGFDYYTRTVFEIVPPVEGRQSTIVGGGRYDGLIQDLGGKPTPGIGFGMGIERVLSDLQRQEAGRPELATTKVLVAHTDSGARLPAMALGSELRGGGVAAVLAPSERSLKGQLRYASSINATHAVIIGQQELERGTVIVRDLGKREQTEVASGDALDRLKEASSPSRP